MQCYHFDGKKKETKTNLRIIPSLKISDTVPNILGNPALVMRRAQQMFKCYCSRGLMQLGLFWNICKAEFRKEDYTGMSSNAA